MMVTFGPLERTFEVNSVEMHHEVVEEAHPGDNVGFSVKNLSVNDIKRGYVASDSMNDPARDTKMFIAMILVLNHPGQIRVGYTPVIDCHTSHIPCKFQKIRAKIDKKTGKDCEEEPPYLKSGDAAIIELVPLKPMVVEEQGTYPSLSRFAIRDMK